MPVSDFLEDLVSRLPALQLLQQVGYQHLMPCKAVDLRGGRRSRVVLETWGHGRVGRRNELVRTFGSSFVI